MLFHFDKFHNPNAVHLIVFKVNVTNLKCHLNLAEKRRALTLHYAKTEIESYSN